MVSDELITVEGVRKVQEKLKDHSRKVERSRLIESLIFATMIYVLSVFIVDENIKSYLLNVSAGLYAAGFAFMFIEKDFQKQQGQLEAADELMTHTLRLVRLDERTRRNSELIEKRRQRISGFDELVENRSVSNNLEVEYLSWNMLLVLLPDLEGLVHDLSEKETIAKEIKRILLDLGYVNEAERIELAARHMQRKTESVQKTLDELTQDLTSRTLDFHNRFVKTGGAE